MKTECEIMLVCKTVVQTIKKKCSFTSELLFLNTSVTYIPFQKIPIKIPVFICKLYTLIHNQQLC